MALNDLAVLFAGVLCAGLGGELFVRGTVGLARWARVSPGIIGATVAAFATSSPELSVSISSAWAGRPQIALGDGLGSNVVNLALILALALLISGVRSPRDTLKRDFPVAVLVPLLTGLLLLDGVLSRADGFFLLGLFLCWLSATVVEARRQRSAAGQDPEPAPRISSTLTLSVLGLGLLGAAGQFIVSGAQGIALSLGVDPFVIGASIVAVGTSVPELATAVTAKLRGHDELGLGTLLGSNIFNGLGVVALAAAIAPIQMAWRDVAVALSCGLLAVVFAYPSRSGRIGRWRGVLLLTLYGVYLTAVLLPASGSLSHPGTPRSLAMHAPLAPLIPGLLVRPVRLDDAQDWAAYAVLPEVKALTSSQVATADDLHPIIQRVLAGEPASPIHFVIRDPATSALVGTVGFHSLSPANGTAEITYDVAPAHWGQGVATAACRAAAQWGFAVKGWHRIQATTLVPHLRSQRVLEKVGFTREGLVRNFRVVRGTPSHYWLYAVLPGELTPAT